MRLWRKIYRKTTELYLFRLYLWHTPKLGKYLHRFIRSDYPVPHDHPWDFKTLILWGGYWEHNRYGQKIWRGVRDVVTHKAEDFHWVEKKTEDALVLTLFTRYKLRKEWGFLTDDGWVQWEEYEEMMKAGINPGYTPTI